MANFCESAEDLKAMKDGLADARKGMQGNEGYVKGRAAGLGIPGVTVG